MNKLLVYAKFNFLAHEICLFYIEWLQTDFVFDPWQLRRLEATNCGRSVSINV